MSGIDKDCKLYHVASFLMSCQHTISKKLKKNDFFLALLSQNCHNSVAKVKQKEKK